MPKLCFVTLHYLAWGIGNLKCTVSYRWVRPESTAEKGPPELCALATAGNNHSTVCLLFMLHFTQRPFLDVVDPWQLCYLRLQKCKPMLSGHTCSRACWVDSSSCGPHHPQCPPGTASLWDGPRAPCPCPHTFVWPLPTCCQGSSVWPGT